MPPRPLIVSRFAFLNAKRPRTAVLAGSFPTQGPNSPLVSMSPRGTGFVTDAVKAAGASGRNPCITRSWISKRRGGLRLSRDAISTRASLAVIRPTTSDGTRDRRLRASSGGGVSAGSRRRTLAGAHPAGRHMDRERLEVHTAQGEGCRQQTGDPGPARKGADRDERLHIRAAVVPQHQPGATHLRGREHRDLQGPELYLALEPAVQRRHDPVAQVRRGAREQ